MSEIYYGVDDLQSALEATSNAIDEVLDELLPEVEGVESYVIEAMRYATKGGKRLRAFLALQSGHLFDVDEGGMLRVAAAVECVHAYSLIHDDLPCMDDDILRRGKPTTHVEFGEPTAILAGDALQSSAFEIISDHDTHGDPYIRCELVSRLARAIGSQGMVGGQMIDIEGESNELDIGAITRLHRLKTGALISFACQAGAVMGRASRETRHALDAFAHDLGLAFQVTDDLLDVSGDAEVIGKTPGKDEARGKATFVSILGVERAMAQAELLADQASKHLDLFDEKADFLRNVCTYVIEREK
jgi:farnesyl diphosphate synthase